MSRYVKLSIVCMIIGVLLLLVSYSTINWNWPPVGFEAAGIVWAVAILGGGFFCATALCLFAVSWWLKD